MDTALRTCRVCGCTDVWACLHEDGSACCWVDDDLCSVCHDKAIEQTARDAARYRYLRDRQLREIDIAAGGVVAGRIPGNVILGGEDLDRAVDAELGLGLPDIEPFEKRLAACLAACIDTPLLEGRDHDHSSPLQLRLGFFRPELGERAAELLEEAGQ